jgi:hypothetical protein
MTKTTVAKNLAFGFVALVAVFIAAPAENANAFCGYVQSENQCNNCSEFHDFAYSCDFSGGGDVINFSPPTPFCTCDCASCSVEDAYTVGSCTCE